LDGTQLNKKFIIQEKVSEETQKNLKSSLIRLHAKPTIPLLEKNLQEFLDDGFTPEL